MNRSLKQHSDLKLPSGFAKSYMSLLTVFVGLNGFRVGDFGLGTFPVVLLCVLVFAGVFGSLLFFKIPLSSREFTSLSLMTVCGFWALANGDSQLFSSIMIVGSSYIAIKRWVHRPTFLFRYVYFFPFLVGLAFYIVYLTAPSLVYEPDAGGKYVQLGPLNLLRFEGAVLNANAYGIGIALLIFCLAYLGIGRARLALGLVSLILSFSYSGVIGFLYLIGAKLTGRTGRIVCIAAVLAILPTYGYVKGWSILESVRIIKYGFYFSNIFSQPASAILWGGIARTGHEWVVLSDNAFLTLLYDHGLIFLVIYYASFFILLRRAAFLIPIFVLLNFVVDLQFFWFANLMFLVAAKILMRVPIRSQVLV